MNRDFEIFTKKLVQILLAQVVLHRMVHQVVVLSPTAVSKF